MKRAEPAMLTFAATDLSLSEAHAPLWRTLRRAARVSRESHAGFLAGSLATAAGYGFAESATRRDPRGRCVVVLPDLSDRPWKGEAAGGDAATPGAGRRQIPKVSLSGRHLRRRSSGSVPGDGLQLVILPERAYVGIDPSDWPSVATPVFLAIALCWRFAALAEQLDALAAWPRGAGIDPGGAPSPGNLPRHELGARLRTLRGFLLDLPCFEGPLIDPRGYFESSRSARLFQTLVKRLALDSWLALIDERVEIVEATLGGLADERRHRDALMCEVVLEVLIFLALLADIAINLHSMSAGAS